MLDTLTQRLARVVKTIRGEARLTETNIQEALREVRVALLEADVALAVVRYFLARGRDAALGEDVAGSLTPGQALVGVVLLAGLQGSGKTTTAAKLAKLLRDGRGKKPRLVACDVDRPAAIEQLETRARQIGVDVFPSHAGEKPLAIALAALDHAKKHYNDVLIVDTAGRLAIDEPMMKEIAELHAALSPVETLFIVDSMQGRGERGNAILKGSTI